MSANATVVEVLKGLADDFHHDAREARHLAQQMRERGFDDQLMCQNVVADTYQKAEQRVRNLLAVWERGQ